MTILTKEQLIEKYNLKESQYDYEFKRSQKSNIHISKWLKRKFEFYHYTYGNKLNEIYETQRLIGSSYSDQEKMVWFSSDDQPPSTIIKMRVDQEDEKEWYRENHSKVQQTIKTISFHPKEMNEIYRFVFQRDSIDTINYIDSDFQKKQKEESFKGHFYEPIFANDYERFIDSTLGEDVSCWSYSKQSSVSIKHSLRLEKLVKAIWVEEKQINLPTRIIETPKADFQFPNYPLLSDLIKPFSKDADWKEVNLNNLINKIEVA